MPYLPDVPHIRPFIDPVSARGYNAFADLLKMVNGITGANVFIDATGIHFRRSPRDDPPASAGNLWLLFERIAIEDGAQTITLTLNTGYGPPWTAPAPPGRLTELIGWSADGVLGAGNAVFKPTIAAAQKDDPNVTLTAAVSKARDTASPGEAIVALDDVGVQVVCDAAFVRGVSQQTLFALVKIALS